MVVMVALWCCLTRFEVASLLNGGKGTMVCESDLTLTTARWRGYPKVNSQFTRAVHSLHQRILRAGIHRGSLRHPVCSPRGGPARLPGSPTSPPRRRRIRVPSDLSASRCNARGRDVCSNTYAAPTHCGSQNRCGYALDVSSYFGSWAMQRKRDGIRSSTEAAPRMPAETTL